jgi:primosomal protein N' (replication factor Y)
MWFNTDMFTVRVIPLAKLPPHAPSVLDYFWPDELPRGSLVRVSLGRRVISALVLDTQDIRSAKLSLKKSSFSLKKLSGIISETPQLSSQQLELARWISTHYACSLATAVSTVAPSFIGKRGSLIPHGTHRPLPHTPATPSTILVTQPDATHETLQTILKKTKGQVLILVPDRFLAESLASSLGANVNCVHAGLTKKEFRSLYQGVLAGTVTAVVGTRSALFLPWTSLAHIVVEDPLHEMYKSDMSPHFNAPDVARHLASLHGANLTWLTAALSTVQFHLVQSGSLKLKHQKPYWPAITLASAESEEREGRRSLFSRAAQNALVEAYEDHAPLLIFSARRGYATVARCGQCRASVECTTCAIPLRWHRTSEDMLVCYHCAAYIPVSKQCPSCRAGTLKPSGTPGSQKLAEAAATTLERFGFAAENIPILDSDLVLTPEDVQRTMRLFDAMKHPILVATSMIQSHRYQRKFSTVLVPHLDMFATNPDYRTQDRLLLQLEKLADFQPERIILQTYQDDGLAPFIAKRSWDDFFTQELAHRKHLRWPPYSRIIKLTFTHRDRGTASRAALVGAERITRAISHIRASGTHLLGPTPSLVERAGGRWTQCLILKSTLPSSKLSELLQYIPEGWAVDIDPRSIS